MSEAGGVIVFAVIVECKMSEVMSPAVVGEGRSVMASDGLVCPEWFGVRVVIAVAKCAFHVGGAEHTGMSND